MDSSANCPGFSPVSIPETMSAFSEIGSNISLDDNKDSSKPSSAHSNLNPEFTFADGNIELQTSDQSFWVHEYQLNKFSGFSGLIQEARRAGAKSNSNGRIIVNCHSASVDIYNTLRVIYASVVSGPPGFDTETLTSALRVATTYGYPDLRSFAVSSLEKVALAPIDRIRLSDELSLPSWEKPAFAELCQRSEPISMAEAQVLGIERFTHVARIREAEQRRQFVENVIEPIKLQCFPGALETKQDSDTEPQNIPSSLPICNCQVTYIGGPRIETCDIHNVAPRILDGYNSLLEERNELLQRLKKLPSIISATMYSNPNGDKANGPSVLTRVGEEGRLFPLEEELSTAPWIRHTGQST